MSDGESLLPQKTRSELEGKANIAITFPLWVLNVLVFIFGAGLILSLLFLAVRLGSKSGDAPEWTIIFLPLFASQGLVILVQLSSVAWLTTLSHRRTEFRKSMAAWNATETNDGEKAISGSALQARYVLYQLLVHPYGDFLPPIPAMVCVLASESLLLVRLNSGGSSPSALVCLLPVLAVSCTGESWVSACD